MNWHTIALMHTHIAGFGRFTLTDESRKVAQTMKQSKNKYLKRHYEMARRDEIWLFHKRLDAKTFAIVIRPRKKRGKHEKANFKRALQLDKTAL